MSDSSDEAGEEIVLQENSERFESEGEHVDAIRQETRGHKAVDLKNMKRRRVLNPSDKYTTSDDESESGQKKRRCKSRSKKRQEATKNGRRTATENGKKSKKPTKNGNKERPTSDGNTKNDSEDQYTGSGYDSESDFRSVVSETVSSYTYCDSDKYRRFDPHKKEKSGIKLTPEMESFVNDNFNKYLPTNKIEDLILKTMPVPIYKAFNVRTIDPIIHSILEEQGEYLNKAF